MNFITDLPLSKEEPDSIVFNALLVVMDHHMKMTHYTLMRKTLISKRFTSLLLQDIIKLHRVSEQIVSDQGSLFTSDF